MAKWYGVIGFEIMEETVPDVWTPTIVEKAYYGDLQRQYHRNNLGDKVSTDISLNCTLSILGDAFVQENLNTMRYATFYGQKWRITDVEPEYPRLILSFGEVYK